MGDENKLLLPWRADQKLVEAAVAAVVATGFERVIVVVGYQGEIVADLLRPYPVEVVVNELYGHGLSTSVRRGIEACPADADTRAFLIALGDMPKVTTAMLSAICCAFLKRGDSRTIAVPVVEGRRGNPVLFGAGYREALSRLEGDRGARHLLEGNAGRVLEVSVGDDSSVFDDPDTPSAYRRLTGADTES